MDNVESAERPATNIRPRACSRRRLVSYRLPDGQSLHHAVYIGLPMEGDGGGSAIRREPASWCPASWSASSRCCWRWCGGRDLADLLYIGMLIGAPGVPRRTVSMHLRSCLCLDPHLPLGETTDRTIWDRRSTRHKRRDSLPTRWQPSRLRPSPFAATGRALSRPGSDGRRLDPAGLILVRSRVRIERDFVKASASHWPAPCYLFRLHAWERWHRRRVLA